MCWLHQCAGKQVFLYIYSHNIIEQLLTAAGFVELYEYSSYVASFFGLTMLYVALLICLKIC